MNFIGVALLYPKSILNSKESLVMAVVLVTCAKILYIAPRATAKIIWSKFFHLPAQDRIIFLTAHRQKQENGRLVFYPHGYIATQ